MSTSTFSWRIVCVVSSALTLLIVVANAGPSVTSTLRGTTGTTLPQPNARFGSDNSVYCPLDSCPSVVLTSAAWSDPWSSAWYCAPTSSALNPAGTTPYTCSISGRPVGLVFNCGGAPLVRVG